MRFTVHRDAFAVAVAKAAQGVPARPAQEIYAGIKLGQLDGQLTLTGSDGDVTFLSLTQMSDLEGSFTSAILPGLLSEVVRYLSGTDVTVEVAGHRVTVSSGRSQFTFPAASGEKYPQLADISGIPRHGVLDGEMFAEMVRRVSPAAAKDTPPVLTAISLCASGDQLTVVATDTSRMARMTCPLVSWGPAPKDALLPARVAERFARCVSGEVVIGWDDKLITLETEGLQVTTRQLTGEFPRWRRLSVPEQGWAEVDAGELSRAVKMASLATDDERDPVTLGLTETGITVESAGQPGTCSQHAECPWKQAPVILRAGWQMLLDGLAACPGTAEIAIGARRAIFLRSDGYLYSLQPRKDQ